VADRVRVWGARAALLFGLGWFAVQLVSHETAQRDVAILGRYSTGYFVFVLLGVAASAAGAVLVLRPELRRLVLADRFRLKMAVFAAWLPVSLTIYALSYTLLPTKGLWNSAFGGLFWAATLAMLLSTFDALRVGVRKAEFWMAVVGVIVALGLAEGAMRYWVRNLVDDTRTRLLYDPTLTQPDLLRYQPHQYEDYILKPGWVSEDGLDRVNSFGYRGDEIEIPKPDGVFRIVALGGSTTYDTEVSDWHDAYPAQLERVLREEYGYTNVEVINGGAGGYNSWESLVNLEFRALDLEPDLVILYQNTNDVHARLVLPDTYRGDNSGHRRPWDAEAVRRATAWPMRVPSVLWRFIGVGFGWLDLRILELDYIVSTPCSGHDTLEGWDECLGMTPEEALEANPPIYYERNVRNIVAVARTNGAEAMLLTWAHNSIFDDYATEPYYQDAFAEHNEIIRRLADELDTYFYDLASDMPLDKEYWADNRHMTAEGNRVRAELIAAYLDEAGTIPKP
jgi:lysophospholipase L1-like esterase